MVLSCARKIIASDINFTCTEQWLEKPLLLLTPKIQNKDFLSSVVFFKSCLHNTLVLIFFASKELAIHPFVSQGRLYVLLLALCMEKALLYIMMKKEKMACFQGYQSKFSFLSTIFCYYLYLECF